MIVRPIPQSAAVHLITQPDHARLARRIMEQCAPLESRPRRASILHAIAEHDNGWEEVDAAPAIDADTGQILDFIHAPLAVRQGVWPRAVRRLIADPWAAALVAQHALTAYGRFRTDPEWADFFADLEAQRDEMLRGVGSPLEGLLDDYRFVRLGDLISLAFCTGRADNLRFAEWAVELSGSQVMVTPDAFAGRTIRIAIEARALPGSRFSSSELAAAFGAAPRTTLAGEVSGRPA